MGHLFYIFPAGNCGPADVSRVRGTSIFDFHHDYVGYPDHRHLARRNGHRAVEEGGDSVEQEIAVEKHSGGVRTLLHRLVFAIHEPGSQVQAEQPLLFRVRTKWEGPTAAKQLLKVSRRN